MFGKLSLLLSVELFVLIAAIFLLVYIAKQQVSKWFTYSTVAVVVTIVGMMICTVYGAMCNRHCGKNRMQKDCFMEEKKCNKMMFEMQGNCPEGMKKEDGNCEMKKECEMKMGDCCKGKAGNMSKEVMLDSLPKKEVKK